jgi:hypothetical protein
MANWKPKREEIERATTAADVLYHGVAFGLMRAAQEDGVTLTDIEAHDLAASLILQELEDHTDEPIVAFYKAVAVCERCGGHKLVTDDGVTMLPCPACVGGSAS